MQPERALLIFINLFTIILLLNNKGEQGIGCGGIFGGWYLALSPLLASVHSDKSYPLEGREALLHNNLHICVYVSLSVCVCTSVCVCVCVFCSVGYSLFTPPFFLLNPITFSAAFLIEFFIVSQRFVDADCCSVVKFCIT